MNYPYLPFPASVSVATLDSPSPAVYLHCAIFVGSKQILQSETFRLVHFSGQEKVSEPFEFQLELHANTDYGQPPLTFSTLMGCAVTFAVQLPVEGSTADDPGWADARFRQAIQGQSVSGLSLFNGMIVGLAMEIPGVYRLTVKPALHRLTLTNHYRILSQMSVAQAIASVLDEHRVAYDMQAIQSDQNIASSRIQDWLQAGESDFDFVRRLLGKAHLHYYFAFSGNQHVLVLNNQPQYQKLPLAKPMRYSYTGMDEQGLIQQDVISQYSFRQNMVSSGVSGVFASVEETWHQPTIPTYTTYPMSTAGDIGPLPFRLNRLYQYGGSQTETNEHTEAAAQSLAATGAQLTGSSYCPLFRSGYQFQVREDSQYHVNPDTGIITVTDTPGRTYPTPVCPAINEQWFVLTQVQHEASLDGTYSNQFEATPAANLITPFSLQDTQQGVLLATVVADGSESAPTDWRYYAKNNFDLSEIKLTDQLSNNRTLNAKGVLVSFATDAPGTPPVWVKLAAHMQCVPEVGVTVLVTKANDESELPEIQSIVHNNGNKVVVPGDWTATTYVGNTYNTNYGDGQSIRYGWNSQVNLDRAIGIVSNSYNSGQYRETSYSQGASYSYSTAEAGYGGLLSRSEAYGSTYSKAEGAMSQNESVFDNTDSTSTVNVLAKSVSTNNVVDNTSTTNVQTSTSTVGVNTANDTIGITNTTSLTGKSTSSQVTGMSDSSQMTGVSKSLSMVGSSSSLSMEGSSAQMSMTGSRSSISLTGSSNEMSMTGSNTSISAIGMRDSTETVGMATSNSLTGMSMQNSMTGMTLQNSLTGMSTSTSLTGMNTATNLTGISTDTSMIGVSTSTKMIGVSNDVTFAGVSNTVSITGITNNMTLHGPGVNIQEGAPKEDIEITLGSVQIIVSISIIL